MPHPSHSSRFYHPNNITINICLLKLQSSLGGSTKYYLITGPTKFWNTVSFLKYTYSLYYSVWCQRDLCSETCKGIRSGGGYHYGLLFSDFLQLPPTSKLDILKTIKCLWDSRSVVINVILGFTIKDGSTIFVLLLEYNFDLSLSQQHFSMQWKKVVIATILKKETVLPLVNKDQFLFSIVFLKFLICYTWSQHIILKINWIAFITVYLNPE
jgi:hypothetical protein